MFLKKLLANAFIRKNLDTSFVDWKKSLSKKRQLTTNLQLRAAEKTEKNVSSWVQILKQWQKDGAVFELFVRKFEKTNQTQLQFLEEKTSIIFSIQLRLKNSTNFNCGHSTGGVETIHHKAQRITFIYSYNTMFGVFEAKV